MPTTTNTFPFDKFKTRIENRGGTVETISFDTIKPVLGGGGIDPDVIETISKFDILLVSAHTLYGESVKEFCFVPGSDQMKKAMPNLTSFKGMLDFVSNIREQNDLHSELGHLFVKHVASLRSEKCSHYIHIRASDSLETLAFEVMSHFNFFEVGDFGMPKFRVGQNVVYTGYRNPEYAKVSTIIFDVKSGQTSYGLGIVDRRSVPENELRLPTDFENSLFVN